MIDRNGIPIRVGDRVRVYGTRATSLTGKESVYGRVGNVERISDPGYSYGPELEVSIENRAGLFILNGGGTNGDWLVIPSLCEKVLEALCAECDSIHGELDYLCPNCRLTV